MVLNTFLRFKPVKEKAQREAGGMEIKRKDPIIGGPLYIQSKSTDGKGE